MDAAAVKVVKEYVLYKGNGDNRQPLFSDPELDVVMMHRLDELRAHLRAGYARPELTVTCRECTYPLDASGNVRAQGSTCDETDVAI